MRLIPIVDVAGLSPSRPRLWPMGIGAGRPRTMERNGAPPVHELSWDEAGRLVEVRTSFTPGVIASRDRYLWRGDELDRSQHFDESLTELFDGAPERERVWRYEGGRPVEVVNVWANGMASVPVEKWTWEGDGRRVTIVESNETRVITTRTLAYDDDGRLARIDFDEDGDGRVDQAVELTWAGGRLVSATERSGAAARVVTYRWDGDRLVGQTDDQHPGTDLWIYRYEEP